MYNPYVYAFEALTCKEARRFYADTAIEHSFLAVAVTGIAIKRTVEAGKVFRQFHDSAIVPATLFVLVGLHQLIQRLDHEEIEEYQTALSYASAPIALLPAAKEVERVLITPPVLPVVHQPSDRVLVTAAPNECESQEETEKNLEQLFQKADALCLQEERVQELAETETTAVADEPEPYADYEFKQLQALCKQRGLSAKGSHKTLITRLTKADSRKPLEVSIK